MKQLFAVLTLVGMTFGSTLVVAGNAGQKDSQPPKEAKGKVGLTINDPRAFKGYTMWSPGKQKKTFMIDIEGRVVKVWECDCEPGIGYLLPNGNLLRTGKITEKL